MRLGDKDYEPRYPIPSCIALENVVNRSLFQIVDEITKSKVPSIGLLSAIIWAGILADDPKITLDEVIGLLQEQKSGHFKSLYAECYAVLFASAARLLFSEKEDEAEDGQDTEEPEKN